MELILNLCKVAGIILASYYSYIALTKRLKNDDGSLTKYGRQSRNGIVISCGLSLAGFFLGAKAGPDPQEQRLAATIRYPLEDVEFYGKMGVSLLGVTQERDSSLFYCKELVKKWRSSKLAPGPYILQNTKNEILELTSAHYDVNPDSCYFSFSGAQLEKMKFFRDQDFVPRFDDQNMDLFFSTNVQSNIVEFIQEGFFGGLKTDMMDFIFHLKLSKVLSGIYYPATDVVDLEVTFTSTPENKTGTIQNMEELAANTVFIYHFDLSHTVKFEKLRTKNGDFFKAVQTQRASAPNPSVINKGLYVAYTFENQSQPPTDE